MLSPRKHHLPKCDIVARQEFDDGSFVEIGEDGLAEIQFRREGEEGILVAAIVSFRWFASDEVCLHDPRKHGQILLTMTDLTRIYSLCEGVGIHLDKVVYYVVVNLLSDTVSIKHNVSLQKGTHNGRQVPIATRESGHA